jgi:hypothetical protein
MFLFLGAFPARGAGNRAFRLYLFRLRRKRIPLQSLALLKNGIHAVFELWVLQGKTQETADAGLLPARLRR